MESKNKKKISIVFLFDRKNNWVKKYFKNFSVNKRYLLKQTYNEKLIKNKDMVFPICYTKKLDNSFLKNNKNTLIIHCSKLPYDKGFAPVQNQILRNQNKIYISICIASEKIDSGDIVYQSYFKLDGKELYDEIREKQAKAIKNSIKNLLKKYPKFVKIKQKKIGTFNKKRKKEDSKLNFNKSIKENFNLLRICNNDLFPGYFIYKGVKYIIKINKEL